MIDKGKPQKKVLSLVLCLAMMLSVMVVGAGAAFTDEKDFSANYQEAAEVLTNLEVLQGYPDGSFQPQGDITRAETAAIIYRVVTGDVTDKYVGNYTANSQNQFSDVKNSDWFAGYVNYCADAQYIKGYGDGTFGPNDKVTGYEALAMILRAVGYDQDGSFTGEKWTINTASVAEGLGILKNVKDEALGSAAPRELVAELIFQSMNVPTVTWTLGLGYNQYNSIMVNGVNKKDLNPTLGEKTFGLAKVAGEIVAVGRTSGTTQIQTAAKLDTVVGTNTPWTDIGYAAYVWTTSTSGAKTRTAVSDLVITGKSLGVSTDGTAFAKLADKTSDDFLAAVDTVDGFNVYYNGKLVGNSKDATKENDIKAKTDLIDKRGVKVDFIDNDNQGLAEAVVITEYTTAEITGIATDTTTSGTSATAASSTYFTTFNPKAVKPVKTANVVSDNALAVGDVVTYVDYKGLDSDTSRYTYASTGIVDSFNKIVRDKENNLYYVIGDKDLYKSEITTLNTSILTKANLGKDVVYYLDEYGYIIKAEAYTAPTQYIFGVSNSHTDGNAKVAAGKVVSTDGSVDTLSIASVKQANNKTYTDLKNNVIEKTLYTYSTNKDGNYELTYSPTPFDKVSHEKGNTNIQLGNGKYYVNNQTVVVDVTDVLEGTATAATVYTGTANIPAMDYGKGYFVADNNNYVSLVFIYDYGTYASDRFMVYEISNNTVTYDKDGNTYTLDVIRDGVQGTVDLTETQFNDIVKKYGVGIYTTDEPFTHITRYTSYAEVYGELTWNNDTVKVTTDKGWTSYSYTSDTTITVLDITNGKVTSFTGLVAGQTIPYVDQNSDNAKGFVEATKNVADHIYFVVGNEATAENNNHVVKDPALANGSVTEYYVEDGKVTGVNVGDPVYYDVTVDSDVWKSVMQGSTVEVPDQGKGGTGAKVTIGEDDPIYVAYGETFTLTADTVIETGYVAWTVNNENPVPVPYQANGGPQIKSTVNVTGNWVMWTRGSQTGWKDITGNANLFASDNADFADGFYKVVVSVNSTDTVTLTKGTLFNDKGQPVELTNGTVVNGTYYAKADTELKLHTDSTSSGDTTYTVAPNDVNISTITNTP